LILKGISGFLSVFFPRFAPLTLKSAFRTSKMKKISGLQPDSEIYQPDVLMNQPSYSEGQTESLPDGKAGLKENPFPSADDASLMSQRADAFIKLITSPIGLTTPRILTADDGVKTPSSPNVRTTCFDVRLLDEFVRLLATFGRLVDVEVFYLFSFPGYQFSGLIQLNQIVRRIITSY